MNNSKATGWFHTRKAYIHYYHNSTTQLTSKSCVPSFFHLSAPRSPLLFALSLSFSFYLLRFLSLFSFLSSILWIDANSRLLPMQLISNNRRTQIKDLFTLLSFGKHTSCVCIHICVYIPSNSLLYPATSTLPMLLHLWMVSVVSCPCSRPCVTSWQATLAICIRPWVLCRLVYSLTLWMDVWLAGEITRHYWDKSWIVWQIW